MRVLKAIAVLCMLVLLSGIAYSADLSDYPYPFIAGSKINTVVVLGDHAKADDVIGSVEIATNLQFYASQKIEGGFAKLASEVEGLEKQNSIIIGGPCANAAAAQVMGFPEDCLEGFVKGKGVLRLYEHAEYGTYSLLIAGANAADTRRAARALVNRDNYDIKGMELDVIGTSFSDIYISKR